MHLPWTKAYKRERARLKLITHIRRTRNLAAVAKSEAECGDGNLACLMAARAEKMALELETLRAEYAALCRQKLMVASE